MKWTYEYSFTHVAKNRCNTSYMGNLTHINAVLFNKYTVHYHAVQEGVKFLKIDVIQKCLT